MQSWGPHSFLLLWIVLLFGCSGFQESEKQKIRDQNTTFTFLESLDPPPFALLPPEKRAPPFYPWEQKWIGSFRKVTQEHFRCKGSYEHSPDIVDGKFYFDCNGSEVHSLPTHRGEERVYPLLIELLGAFQELTGKEIVVTCGHRCPRHNQYADSTAKNRVSKHQVGGEVDFYVIGMEWESEKVVELLLYCYRLSKSIYKNSSFTRCKRQTLRTPTWKNQELEISISQLDERRDKDNDHSYPYITIELFYDYQTQKPVRYSWHSAHYSLFRYDFETSFR